VVRKPQPANPAVKLIVGQHLLQHQRSWTRWVGRAVKDQGFTYDDAVRAINELYDEGAIYVVEPYRYPQGFLIALTEGPKSWLTTELIDSGAGDAHAQKTS
jgi:hypothetical protein